MLPSRSHAAALGRLVIATLLLTNGLGCGKDSTGPGGSTEAVDSVVITGAPTTTMLVGDSVRLVASAVNSTGGIISDQRITWKSSAPAVAGVRDNGTVLALGAGTATITATASGKDGTVDLDIAFGVTIGTQGGVVTAAGGAFKLSVPAGAVSQATLLLVRPVPNAPADPRLVPGTAYELGPDGVSLFRAATLTLVYDPAKIPSGLAGESLQLDTRSGDAWAPITGSNVDLTTKAVTGSVSHSGTYVVRSTPVDRITLSGAVANGGLYVGQTSQLQAGLYASAGDSLPPRPISWTSSDVSKVTVDASGKVAGVAAGSATITATTDGKSASTNVTILARPTADWTAATDWITYESDFRHSGYVDASVDPGVFKEKWVVTLPGGSYYQPTVGGNRVYLSTNLYFGTQQVVAVSSADGSVSWKRDFGQIFGINQPTYDNGSLYVTSGGHADTYLWSLNSADGSLNFQTAFDSQWEHWKAPVVSGSTILTAGGYYGGMYGFDRSTGQQKFFMSGPQVDGWAPAIGADGLAYATDYVANGGVRAVNPVDGSISADIQDSRLTAVITPVAGKVNDLLTIIGNTLISVDLVGKKVAWTQSASYTGMPVVGNGVVYGISGTTIAARSESDGSLLWSWTPPLPYTAMQTLALTRNVLFVGVSGGYGTSGATLAVDLASHIAVWSYPMTGDFALSSEGLLYITQGSKLAAISLR